MNNIKICLWNWADYNNGVASWEWFTLPEDAETMYEWIKTMNNDGKEEIFICDSEHSFISESTSIVALIELSNTEYDEIIELASYEPAYDIEMLDEMLQYHTPSEIIRMIHFGDYSPLDDYFMFNGYANIETMTETEYERYREDAFNEGASEFLRNY